MENTIQTNKMAKSSLLPLLLSMAFPPMLSMLIQSLYNIIDSMFVARISQDALTAVSLAFPVQNLILAFALGTGIGVNSYISRKLGEQQIKEANKAATLAVYLAGCNGLIFILVGFIFIKPFFQLFTDSQNVVSLSCQYTYIITYFSFGTLFHIAIEKILQATGKMILPMIFQAVGAIINIILDPIFIFGIGNIPAFGIKGAAIATIIGQLTSMLLSFIVILRGNHSVTLEFKNTRIDWHIIKQIYIVGIPSMLMTALSSVLVMGLNAILASLSFVAVSLFGVYFKLQTFVYMPVSGLIQAAMPIMGYNYGAGNKQRLLTTLKLAIGITFIIMCIGTFLFQRYPIELLSMFQPTEEMLEIGIPALRVLSLSYIPATIGFMIATLFQAMGKGMFSLIIFLLRQLVIILPTAIFLSQPFGLMGIWVAFPFAEILSTIASIFLFRRSCKKEPIFYDENFLNKAKKI